MSIFGSRGLRGQVRSCGTKLKLARLRVASAESGGKASIGNIKALLRGQVKRCRWDWRGLAVRSVLLPSGGPVLVRRRLRARLAPTNARAGGRGGWAGVRQTSRRSAVHREGTALLAAVRILIGAELDGPLQGLSETPVPVPGGPQAAGQMPNVPPGFQ